MARLWHEDEGLLTFEYILLNTMLVMGTVGAVNGIRTSLNSELNGLNESMRSLDEMRPANLATATSTQSGSTGTAVQPAAAASPMPLVGADLDAATSTAPAGATSGATPPLVTPTSGTASSGVQA